MRKFPHEKIRKCINIENIESAYNKSNIKITRRQNFEPILYQQEKKVGMYVNLGD